MIKTNKEFNDTLKHAREFRKALRVYDFEIMDDGGILFPKQELMVKGLYEHESSSDGLGLIADPNLIPTEGLNHIWSAVIDAGTQITAWYVAIHSGTSSPAAGWTASNYASNATEITSSYSESVRQAYTSATPSSGSTNNTASKAVFTSNTTSVSVWGAALLSSSTKGGTSGTLLSATKFSAVRTLAESGDTISIGITYTATSS